ncbi:hypothetical protein PG994_003315 [Apiospora phragmitis]|uniref:Uncharacterized protein n=1 Tax=Apiospora phragmitis TaxID=2905665 RepID=A0ABR1VXS9_9PEZI
MAAQYQSQVKKVIIATGASSGLGFEAMKQLLEAKQFGSAYTVVVGARDEARAITAYAQVKYDNLKHHVKVLRLDLANLVSVREFAKNVLAYAPDEQQVDYLFLCAAMSKDAGPSSYGSKWCDAQVVNHLSHHYLMHLLRNKLVASKSRIVVVSSGGIRRGDPVQADNVLLANSGADGFDFTQLLNAHWWRRQLAGSCTVVAVSPGLIPMTGIFREYKESKRPTMKSQDAKTVEEGAQSLLRAFKCTDMPDDPDRIFLTSWGQWWERSDIQNTLDRELQEKWSPSEEKIRRE